MKSTLADVMRSFVAYENYPLVQEISVFTFGHPLGRGVLSAIGVISVDRWGRMILCASSP